jgi:transposase
MQRVTRRKWREPLCRLFAAFDADMQHIRETVTLYETQPRCETARFAWNWALNRKQEAYKATGRSIRAMELHRELNDLKQTEYPWLYEVSKCAPQEALRALDVAFSNFFRRVRLKKEGKWRGPPGYPKFKSKRKGLGGFKLTSAIHVYEDAVDLPRLVVCASRSAGICPPAASMCSLPP